MGIITIIVINYFSITKILLFSAIKHKPIRANGLEHGYEFVKATVSHPENGV